MIHELWKRYKRDKRIPAPGEVWVLKTDRGPFPDKNAVDVHVLAVKDGFVNYSIGTSGLYSDEVLSVSRFTYCYCPKKKI